MKLKLMLCLLCWFLIIHCQEQDLFSQLPDEISWEVAQYIPEDLSSLAQVSKRWDQVINSYQLKGNKRIESFMTEYADSLQVHPLAIAALIGTRNGRAMLHAEGITGIDLTSLQAPTLIKSFWLAKEIAKLEGQYTKERIPALVKKCTQQKNQKIYVPYEPGYLYIAVVRLADGRFATVKKKIAGHSMFMHTSLQIYNFPQEKVISTDLQKLFLRSDDNLRLHALEKNIFVCCAYTNVAKTISTAMHCYDLQGILNKEFANGGLYINDTINAMTSTDECIFIDGYNATHIYTLQGKLISCTEKPNQIVPAIAPDYHAVAPDDHESEDDGYTSDTDCTIS